MEQNRSELQRIKNDFVRILNELSYIKNTFGKDYYRLDIPKEKNRGNEV